uniref:Uncharacterized protein n=1 Tax=viral metagenome TaxID=1070528 RepID=A0A6C0KS83_9ZZZZ
MSQSQSQSQSQSLSQLLNNGNSLLEELQTYLTMYRYVNTSNIDPKPLEIHEQLTELETEMTRIKHNLILLCRIIIETRNNCKNISIDEYNLVNKFLYDCVA